MKLGGSLRRRRRGKKRRGPRGSSGSGGGPGRFVLTLLGLGLGGWLVGYLVATQIVFPAPPPPGDLHPVPDLRGMGLTRASERASGAQVTLGAVDSLQHPTVPAGTVLGQSPLPGQLATPGTPVRVTVSTGPQRRAVPDVLRLDEERARIILETSGFVVRADTVESDVARGRVVEVTPGVDSVLALPAEVALSVSTGPPLVLMPRVLGMNEEAARDTLELLGLEVTEVEEVFRFGRDQGIVVEQEPGADTELDRGSEVRLAVGRRGR